MKLSTNASSANALLEDKLEECLNQLENGLANLGQALLARDAQAIDAQASVLQGALAYTVDHFARAARKGPLPAALRTRLVLASGQVAAQRESLARATAALDRAIEVLIPAQGPALYSASGSGQRGLRVASLQA